MKKSFANARRREEGGVHYKHDLGQHFLYDEELLRSLVAATGVDKTDRVLEIGPGAGTLTKCLCEAAGQVIAVEVDHDVIPFLRMRTEGMDNLTIVEGVELATEEYGIAFRKGSDITDAVNTAIVALVEDGTLPALAEKYGLSLSPAIAG